MFGKQAAMEDSWRKIELESLAQCSQIGELELTKFLLFYLLTYLLFGSGKRGGKRGLEDQRGPFQRSVPQG